MATRRLERLKIQPHDIQAENTLRMLRVLWDRLADLQEENRRLLEIIRINNLKPQNRRKKWQHSKITF